MILRVELERDMKAGRGEKGSMLERGREKEYRSSSFWVAGSENQSSTKGQ